MNFKNDPIGYAIHDFINLGIKENIVVKSDLCEDDDLPIPYLFRGINEMPALEQFAMSQCEGKILDIGAGAGCHSIYLQEEGFKVKALERSKGASDYLITKGIDCYNLDFMQYNEDKFDTILLLMNGIGLAGSLDQLSHLLKHLKTLLTPEGKILCDSTDVNYMYTNEDGSVWMDLNAKYYGEMNFNMIYKGVESGWFPWLYVDPQKLTEHAIDEGFEIEILLDGENNHYLAELKIE